MDINKARAGYGIALSRALSCDAQLLLENGLPKKDEAEVKEKSSDFCFFIFA